MRFGFLAIVGGLALCACAGTPNDQPIYGAHSYSCCAELTADMSWIAGQHVTLHWQPTPPGRTTDPTTHRIVLTVGLTGPFPTVDALKQATSNPTKPAGVRTINAAPVSANDRTVDAPASQLDLPSDLAYGYYNLETRASSAGQSVVGGAVIIIVP